MAFYIRKAFKVGPFRLNLSKGGLGLSMGVTGLRIGVDPKGGVYTHMGRYGVYYKKYIGNSSLKNGSTVKNGKLNIQQVDLGETEPNSVDIESIKKLSEKLIEEGFPKRKFPAWLWIIPLLLLFFPYDIMRLMSFAGFILVGTLHLGTILINYYEKAKVKIFLFEIRSEIEESRFEELKEKLNVFFNKKGRREIKNYLLASVYVKLIPKITEDLQIDSSEKDIITFIKENIEVSEIGEVDRIFLEYFMSSFSEEGTLTEKQKTFLEDYMQLFYVSDDVKKEVGKIISYYDELNKIRDGQYTVIIPSVPNIDNPDSCYYEDDFIEVHYRSGRLRDRGKLFVTSDNIQFVGKGHKKINFNKILSVRLTSDETKSENVVFKIKDRKTPFVISCNDCFKLTVLLHSLLIEQTK